MKRREAMEAAVEMLGRVRMPDARRRAAEYPHQMSGGMRQRVMIAMALACNPDLLIADEPTTALDVTVQAQILNLMEELQAEFGSAILMITHDLGIIAETSDDVAVMYAGQLVETAPTTELFARPLHPYTQGLMKSVPRIEQSEAVQALHPIPGQVPDPAHHPAGCRFHPRCAFAAAACREQAPALEVVSGGLPAASPSQPGLPAEALAQAGHAVRCLEIESDPAAAERTADLARARAADAG